ncbi:MAG: TetR/AcrR family transcriptional regulator [Rhodospirillaceae bacterium]
MARPLAFERRAALERAMQTFWTRGYAATSVNDLTQAMGLSKSSLYGAFGDKHALFLEAIAFYRDNVSAQVRSVAELRAPARQVIRAVLGRAADRILEPDGRRGCFLNNAAVEVGPTDVEAAAGCRSGLDVMEETFRRLVERGQREGHIPAARDAQALARFLTGTVHGIMVIGKANPDRRALEDIVDTAMAALA